MLPCFETTAATRWSERESGGLKEMERERESETVTAGKREREREIER